MDDGTEFEAQVRDSFRRLSAPEGFATRVLARTSAAESHAERGSRWASWFGGMLQPQAAWQLAAAVLLLTVMGGEGFHLEQQRRERERAALADRQFTHALQLTDHALNQVAASLEKSRLSEFSQFVAGPERGER